MLTVPNSRPGFRHTTGRRPRACGIGQRSGFMLALASAILAIQSAPVVAAEPDDPRVLSMLVLGDSYSAGNGADGYDPNYAKCFRSAHNYAREFERIVEVAPYRQRSFVENRACSGAVTSDFFEGKHGRPPMSEWVNHGYDVIFLTIGGNDASFSDIVKYCLVNRFKSAKECNGNIQKAEKLLADGTLAARIRVVLETIRSKARSDARIVLVGYPYLEGDPHYLLDAGKKNPPVQAGRRIRAIGDDGELVQRELVDRLNAEREGAPLADLIFASTKPIFAGHELYADRWNQDDPQAWLWKPFEGDKNLGGRDVWYHPKPIGWRAEAKMLVDRLMPLPLGGSAVAVAAGGYHSCALRAHGAVGCWGWNYSGQLGDGTNNDSLAPVRVSALTDATQITAGYVHSCARRNSGAIACWGYNNYGALGNGSTASTSTPVAVSGLTDVSQVAAGMQYSCALRTSGTVSCWGFNGDGRLGNGSTTDSLLPVDVSGVTDARQISTGSNTCVLHKGGTVSCWGYNGDGRLGNGTTNDASTAVKVTGITNAVQVAVGAFNSCALRAGGKVSCWGDNSFGQIGDGSTATALTPRTVTGISNATSVSVGEGHACAVRAGGAVSCWGYNNAGQLGDGTSNDASAPVRVRSLDNAVEVTAGGSRSCARLATGEVRCWGQGGQLGDGTTNSSPTPVSVIEFP